MKQDMVTTREAAVLIDTHNQITGTPSSIENKARWLATLCKRGVFPGAVRVRESRRQVWQIPRKEVEAYAHANGK
jgi:hypothetical protein